MKKIVTSTISSNGKGLMVRVGKDYYKVAYGISGNFLQAWINLKIRELKKECEG